MTSLGLPKGFLFPPTQRMLVCNALSTCCGLKPVSLHTSVSLLLVLRHGSVSEQRGGLAASCVTNPRPAAEDAQHLRWFSAACNTDDGLVPVTGAHLVRSVVAARTLSIICREPRVC